MSKKQTAVEWLEEIYLTTGIDRNVHFNQAKAMEKEQLLDMGNQFAIMGEDSPEQYYNKTYESKESDDHIGDANEMVEISDEEIIKLANEYILYNDSKRQWVIEGMKLYREQLKKK